MRLFARRRKELRTRENVLRAKRVEHWIPASPAATAAITDVLAGEDVKGRLVEALEPFGLHPVEVRPSFFVPVYEDQHMQTRGRRR